jgi:hypothetical protein
MKFVQLINTYICSKTLKLKSNISDELHLKRSNNAPVAYSRLLETPAKIVHLHARETARSHT